VRGWDKHLPGRILGALPTRQWVKRLQPLGRGLLVRLWRHVEGKSPATRRRWQWTWVADDTLFKKYGRQLGLVGLGWRRMVGSRWCAWTKQGATGTSCCAGRRPAAPRGWSGPGAAAAGSRRAFAP
jgi:hypothetical protein